MLQCNNIWYYCYFVVKGLVADHMRGADVEDPTPDLEVVPEKDLEGIELVQGQELDQDQGI